VGRSGRARGRDGGGPDAGFVRAVGPEHGGIFEEGREGAGFREPVVGPGDLGRRRYEGVGEDGIVVGEAAFPRCCCRCYESCGGYRRGL
jgi:hypothetical protein